MPCTWSASLTPARQRLGSFGATRLAQQRGLLNLMFAGLVVVVALYMLWRSAQALFGA